MRPVFAHGLFNVSPGLITNHVLYIYEDTELEFKHIFSSRKRVMAEAERLRKNMQAYLDSEKILINGDEVRAEVVHVAFGYEGVQGRAFIEYIIEVPFKPRPGINEYIDEYGEEVAEYSYRVVWLFPRCGRVLEADLGVSSKVFARKIVLNVRKGQRLPGRERIVFFLGTSCIPGNSTEEVS